MTDAHNGRAYAHNSVPIPGWGLRRPGGQVEPYYATANAAYARARELDCETVTILQHQGGDHWSESKTLDARARCYAEPESFDHSGCSGPNAPQIWTLHYDGKRGVDGHMFTSAADALAALEIEAREGWYRIRDLGREDLHAEPPADAAQAITVFHDVLGIAFSLDAEDAR
ncbi:hypothetical protein [Nonomuraea sp. NPDC049695]|uniref:hypothetical protein n=1 Tax=Nonomuraea sp. NPDC049695 TaxID=3154734 RepID=UPI00343E1F5D